MGNEVNLQVDGMDCPSCTVTIEGAVCALPGVRNVQLNYQKQHLMLDLDNTGVDKAKIARTIRTLGYEVQDITKGAPPAEFVPWFKTRKGRLVLLSGTLMVMSATLYIVTRLNDFQPDLSPYGFAIAALIALFPMARKAFGAAQLGNPFTIETLVSIAVIGPLLSTSPPRPPWLFFCLPLVNCWKT